MRKAARLLTVQISMRRIPLTQGEHAIIDDEDYPLISQFKWHLDRRVKRVNVLYAKRQVTIGKKKQRGQLMHRLIMKPPDGLFVDHINGDGLDNRRLNLRLCNNQENSRNQRRLRKNKTSRYKGVSFRERNGKWEAQINRDRRVTWLGQFDIEEDAALMYNVAAQIFFGDFAVLNDV
jgi:hypothetical protein